MPAYLTGVLQYDPRQAVFSQTVGVLASALGILLAGWLGDRIPPRYLLRLGVTLLLVLSYPFYLALEARSVDLTLLLVLAGLAAGLTNGSFAVLLTDLFPTRIRFTGVALGFNISFTLFSGTAPLVATSLIGSTGQMASPAFLMMACALIALVGSWWVERYGGHVLTPQS
jgi:MFS family permease